MGRVDKWLILKRWLTDNHRDQLKITRKEHSELLDILDKMLELERDEINDDSQEKLFRIKAQRDARDAARADRGMEDTRELCEEDNVQQADVLRDDNNDRVTRPEDLTWEP